MNISLKNGRFLPLVFIVAVYLSSLILLPLIFINVVGITDKSTIRLLTLIFQVLAVFVIFKFTSKVTVNSIEKNPNKFSLTKSISYGIVFFVAMFILQIILGIILQIFAKIYGFNPTSANTSQIGQAIKQYPLLIIYVVLLAPILEELVFRKAIFAYIYDILKGSKEELRFIIAGILSGLLFAIPHDGFTPLAIVYIIMAMVFSYAYKMSSNIIVPIVAHILMNTIVVVSQYYLT